MQVSHEFNLEAERISRGLSQSELGSKLNVTRQTVAAWEKGTRSMSLKRLTDIRNVLDDIPIVKQSGGGLHQEAPVFEAKVSLERLYHFRCGKCNDWWTVGDRRPRINSIKFCTKCGAKNRITLIELE
jgi:transcriptional regulator with XRE-family HTH domain